MPEASVGAPALIEWGVASLALPGEAESGDRHLVKPVGTGVLVAVVDGLGHGAEAAAAAQAAVAALERHATESPVRSEEHTSELQSQSNLVCRLLLEKKNQARMLELLWTQMEVRSQPRLAAKQCRQ